MSIMAKFLLLFGLVFTISNCVSGQSNINSPNPLSNLATQDPTAKSYVIQALEAMGAPGGAVPHQSAVASGTVIDQTSPQDPRKETLWAKGATRFRIDWENSTSKHSYAIAQGVRSATHSVGVDHRPPYVRVLRARPNFFPMFSLLAEWNRPNTTITLLPDEMIGDRRVHVVWLSTNEIGDTGIKVMDPHITGTTFYIDPQTFQLVRLSNDQPPGPAHPRQLREYIDYADYRSTGDMVLPFQQSTYVGERLTQVLTLTSVQFDDQLDDSVFTLGGGSNGK